MNRARDTGIIAVDAYVPTHRIERGVIAAAMGWAVPAIKGMAKGERSVANWDEDTVTMAVEAGRRCLGDADRPRVGHVTLASTTAPFADRSNSGIVSDALHLGDEISTEDAAGSRRAGTSALMKLLDNADTGRHALLAASDCRETRPGSPQEMQYGHGAAAVLVGRGEPLALFLGGASLHHDLVDQYRARGREFDYALESRWVREEGYLKIIPAAVQTALADAGIAAADVHHLIVPGPASVVKELRRVLGMEQAAIADPLSDRVGDTGAAQPLLMLAALLADCEADQNIVLTGFGQGADVIVLRTTAAASRWRRFMPEPGRRIDNYVKFLVLRRRLEPEYGIRAERDNRTALSAFYRKRRDITGFVGGRCRSCGTLQFPLAHACINCRQMETLEPESLAELKGTVKSFTEDWLAYTPSPPLIYGNVTFPGGANVLMEFSDFEPGEVRVGTEVGMAFRIKDFDEARGFRRYFWKSVPPVSEAAGG